VASLLSSCTLATQDHTPEPVAARLSPVTWAVPTETATPLLSPATASPTQTPTVGATPVACEARGTQPISPETGRAGEAQRLRFELGTTTLSTSWTEIAACQVHDYVIKLRKGESLWVQAWPDGPYEARDLMDVLVTGLGDGWIPTGDHAPNPATWLGTVPTTQDYRIAVANRGPATHYLLSVDVPRWLDLESAGGRITLPGLAGEEGLNSYNFHADAGDRLSIEITSPGDAVWFTLVGPDAQPIIRAIPEGTHQVETVASLTGDYNIIAGLFCCEWERVEYTITVVVGD
jgi:hypothetical protein